MSSVKACCGLLTENKFGGWKGLGEVHESRSEAVVDSSGCLAGEDNRKTYGNPNTVLWQWQ